MVKTHKERLGQKEHGHEGPHEACRPGKKPNFACKGHTEGYEVSY